MNRRTVNHRPPPTATAYWNGVLDAQNLERAAAPALPLEMEIAFTQTPDFRCAAAWLEGAPAAGHAGGGGPGFIVDLGAGLGAQAFALARRGHRVVAVDTSPARLHALRARARQAGVAGRITCLVAAAEALPFRSGALQAVHTKSVLIHTDLPRAAAELARVLAPGGRAALTEPQPGNPLVALYRRTLAPQAWRGITTYFGPAQQAVFCRALEGEFAPARQIKPFYVLGFLAFGFQFALPAPRLFRLALKLLGAVDALLLRLLPPLRAWAWFGVLRLERPRDA